MLLRMPLSLTTSFLSVRVSVHRETLKYVQDQTGVKKIGVVGHSQGATLVSGPAA